MFIGLSAVAAVLATFLATSASAATVTIEFEGPKSDPYIEDGYSFTPVKLQNSTQCAEGTCTQEADEGQNLITTMTRVDGEAFLIYSFYFSLEGEGGPVDESGTGVNSLWAIGYDDLNNVVGMYEFVIGEPDSYGVLYYYQDGSTGSDPIAKSTGANGPFYVAMDDPLFGGEVYAVSWFGPDTAKTRLDDIVVSEVPLPASLPALAGGLGLLAFFRRRRLV